MPLENGVLIASLKTRGAPAAALASANPALLARELCLETDTSELGSDGVRRYKAKLGPGNWNSLAYVGIGAGITEAQMQALITAHSSASDPHGDRAYADGLVNALGTAAHADTGTAAGDVPVLGTGGKLPSGMLPPVAITDTFPVDDEVEMLALDAQVGDVAVRSDESKSYILRAEPASTLGNWVWLRTPTDAVLSVAGLTGAVLASDLKTALGIDALKVDTISGAIRKAADGTYVLDLSAPFAYSITSLTIASASGTATAKVTIDGVDVTGISAVAVSSSEAVGTASADNAVAAGATVALVISSSAAAERVAFTLKILRA